MTYKNVNLFVGSSLLKSGIVNLQLSRLVAARVSIARSLTSALSLLLNFITHPVRDCLLGRSIVVAMTIPLLAWCLVGSYGTPTASLILIVENVFNALNIFFKSLIKR